MKDELPDLIAYLQHRFNTPKLTARMHPKKQDMAEIYIGEEFVAPIYREEEDGEVSYQLQMAILDFDLEEFKAQ
ncbi:MAG: DUF3126 family protein [Pseudomonadota bacterium]